MANHGFISSRKHFKKDKVSKDLQEINERRFKGLLKIEDGNYGKDSWFISYQAEEWEYPEGFNIWIRSPRVIEHRHGHNWVFYLEVVFKEELGVKYDAILSDEGHQQKWKPNPKKYPTYRAWLEGLYSRSVEKYPEAVKKFIDIEFEYAPLELRDC